MKPKLTLGLLTVGLMLGCVPSLNPLYTEQDLIFDPALVGSWSGDNEKETWLFEKSGDKAYKLKQTDEDGHTALFEAHLFKLKDYKFLDLYLVQPWEQENKESKMNGYAGFALIPAHMFLKVTSVEPTLQMAFLDPDWLKDVLEKDPKAIRHKKLASEDNKDDRIALTAETKDLQQFILKHITDKKIFGEPGEFKRKKESNP
jgi:hypothetical protein